MTEEQIQEGMDYSLVRYIHRRINNNKNFLATITGPTGSGKSWSALSMAELIDPNFSVNNIIFKGRELMKLINEGELKAGSVIIWDEAGIDLSNRNWQSVTNKMLNALLQTFRHRNFILFFTVPYHDFIDSSSKKLFHADFETQKINKGEQKVIIKPKLLQYNSNLSKWYRKYLKVSLNGSLVKIRRWKVPKPSDELIKEYEIKRKMFTKNLNKDIDKQLLKLEGPEVFGESQPAGLDVTCPNCNNAWNYKGAASYINCPNCYRKFKNPKIKFPLFTTIPPVPT
jgi:ABC-type lipoprotein export system ATPase subunit